MAILNLTQHPTTEKQRAQGVIEPREVMRGELAEEIKTLLTFDSIPTREEMLARAEEIAWIVTGDDSRPKKAMIGGAPYFMGVLERVLVHYGIEPVYSFSKRVSIEEMQPDGSTKKTSVFRHEGFVRPYEKCFV